MTPDTVAVILRNRGEIRVCRPGATTARDRWTTVLGPVTDESETARERRDGDAIADSAREHLRAEAGVTGEEIQFVRAGEPVRLGESDGPAQDRKVDDAVPEGSDSRPDRVVPVLFDCESRSIAGEAGQAWEWIAPPALLEGDSTPWLWRAYDGVRPTVETIADDTEHGSTTLSVRALEVLRDEAALAARTDADPSTVRDVARDLIAARSSMTAVRNRLNRVMTAADGEDLAASVATAAHDAIQRAIDADGEAAANAATRIAGDRVATLSRSGTVLEAIAAREPSAVLVAESRPGREGVTVAETLAGDCAVTVTTDAAFPGELTGWEADSLLVGADTVLPDGRVLNKVGTYPASAVATREGIPVLVVTSADKISPDAAIDPEPWPDDPFYEGPAPVSIANPTFEVTPAACIDAVVTERGALDAAAVEEIAAEHRRLTAWNGTE